jgi:antitoxin VapB
MALSIKHPEADRLARELAARTGESLTDTVLEALRQRLRRERGRVPDQDLKDEILAIARRSGALPRRTDRSPNEIIGYDERGVPS